MAETALVILLGAVCGCSTTGIGICLKQKTGLDKVNIRCKYEDSSCMFAIKHEDTEIEEKVRQRTDAELALKDTEIKHEREMYEINTQLNDKEQSLKIAELELALRQKSDEISKLNKLMDGIRDDYISFRESISRMALNRTNNNNNGGNGNNNNNIVPTIQPQILNFNIPPYFSPPPSPPRRQQMVVDEYDSDNHRRDRSTSRHGEQERDHDWNYHHNNNNHHTVVNHSNNKSDTAVCTTAPLLTHNVNDDVAILTPKSLRMMIQQKKYSKRSESDPM